MATADTRTSATAPGAHAGREERRYSTVAIVLHWAIAVLILVQIGLGWYMNEILPDHSPAQDRITTLHVSIGLTVLLLVLVRIGWRLINPPPPLAPGTPGWQRVLAHASHLLFYLLMLALPLTGWAMVSLGKNGIGFWGLPWPHLPGVSQLAGANPRPLRRLLKGVHTYYLIWIVLLNLALHIAGALKHQLDGRLVLERMLPRPARR